MLQVLVLPREGLLLKLTLSDQWQEHKNATAKATESLLLQILKVKSRLDKSEVGWSVYVSYWTALHFTLQIYTYSFEFHAPRS